MAKKHTKAAKTTRRKKEDAELVIDPKTARRMLQYVNAATRPEDLVYEPSVLTHLHVEYRKPGFPERHPPADHHERRPKRILDLAVAKDVLAKRDLTPVYGFLRLEELLVIDRIRELLRKWWFFFSRASRGEWTGPFDIPSPGFDRPVHGALLRSGKVLFFGLPTGKDTWLWTPSGGGAGTFAATSNQPGDSLFCSGHSFLSDGRLLVVGGGGDGTGPRHNRGWIFNPEPGVESWTRTAGDGTPNNGDMAFYRWYPTLVTLGTSRGACSSCRATTPGATTCLRWRSTWRPPIDSSASGAPRVLAT